MNPKSYRLLGVIIAASVWASGAHAQVLSVVTRLVDQGLPQLNGIDEVKNSEVVISANLNNPDDLLVGWIKSGLPITVESVYWSVSLDGGVTFTTGAPLLSAGETVCTTGSRTGDPMIARLHTGEMWLGSLVGEPTSSMLVKRKAPGQSSLAYLAQIVPCAENPPDKGLLAVGPWWSNHQTKNTMYAGFSQSGIRSTYATDNPAVPAGADWSDQNGVRPSTAVSDNLQHTATGKGAFPAVVGSVLGSPAPVGRVLPAHSQFNIFTGNVAFWYTDAGGGAEQWHRSGQFTTTAGGANILGVNDTANEYGIWIPGGITPTTMPTVAINRGAPESVIAAFAGRLDTSDHNLDLFVAISTNTGSSFLDPNDPTIPAVYHLGDAVLSLPGEGESDQWLPTVEIDKTGAVNLAFCWTNTPDRTNGQPTPWNETHVHVRLARWPSVEAMRSGPPPVLFDLPAPSGAVADSAAWVDGSNEYMMVTSSGCDRVYVAWVGKLHPTTILRTWDVYVTRIDLVPCVDSDMNANRVVSPDDVAMFSAAFAAGDASADLNHDGIVDCADAVRFYGSYACGCNP